MGFGHRVYKSYDPRARIIKQTADEVFAVTGRNPLLDIALELERIALEDDYFVSRKLYPNVDFYSGLIYQAMGFPVDMFPVLFAIPRTAGWLAQWDEMLRDPDQKIARPRQVYIGAERARLRRERASAPSLDTVRHWRTAAMKRLGWNRRRRRGRRSASPGTSSSHVRRVAAGAVADRRRRAAAPSRPSTAPRPSSISRQMVAIGPRPSGSPAIRQTRAYITRAACSALGLTVEEQPFVAETPKGPIEMVNLIVRLPGKRPDRILFTGHYDTKLILRRRLRRRQRRRLERGVPDRARPRAQGPAARVHL